MGTRRTSFYPRRDTKGREELLFDPRSHAEGRGNTFLIRGVTRRGAENIKGVSGFLCVTSCPSWIDHVMRWQISVQTNVCQSDSESHHTISQIWRA